MTEPTVALSELLDQGPDTGLPKQMIQFVALHRMERDVEGLCNAGSDIKSLSRNGYQDRLWQTRTSDVDLRIT